MERGEADLGEIARMNRDKLGWMGGTGQDLARRLLGYTEALELETYPHLVWKMHLHEKKLDHFREMIT